MTPEEETDALLDALGRGLLPDSARSGDPAARLLAAMVRHVLDDSGEPWPAEAARPSGLDGGLSQVSVFGDGGRAGASPLGEVGQRRSSVSMTPST